MWHFNHGFYGYPVSFDFSPPLLLFPLALIDEGHTGVSLFMTLSGYLFAKLLDGKSINYWAFLWNRVLRIAPLFAVVFLIIGIQMFNDGEHIRTIIHSIVSDIAHGLIYPDLPNGGWSITTEFHYYAVIPLFLWMLRKSKFLPILIVVAAIGLRLLILHKTGEIKALSYWTIVGRIDQFAIGMIVYHFRAYFAKRHILAAAIFIAFALFFWHFDVHGGIMASNLYSDSSLFWIFLPTIEGITYGIGIAWYDNSFSHSTTGVSKFIGRVGTVSYSIYLLHFFFYSFEARFVDERIMHISNFYLASLWATAFFFLMVPVGLFSFRFIESPFLKLRKSYVTGVRL